MCLKNRSVWPVDISCLLLKKAPEEKELKQSNNNIPVVQSSESLRNGLSDQSDERQDASTRVSTSIDACNRSWRKEMWLSEGNRWVDGAHKRARRAKRSGEVWGSSDYDFRLRHAILHRTTWLPDLPCSVYLISLNQDLASHWITTMGIQMFLKLLMLSREEDIWQLCPREELFWIARERPWLIASISRSKRSPKSFQTWIDRMSDFLGQLWLTTNREMMRRNLPRCFKPDNEEVYLIIDCTELFIEKPSQVIQQSATCSKCKCHNTGKGLIALSPLMLPVFVSIRYAGNKSDEEILSDSSILSHAHLGDRWLADKGFLGSTYSG